MKQLTIIVPEGNNNLSSVVGPFKIFSKANEYWGASHKQSLFNIKLAGLSRETTFYNGLFMARPHCDIAVIESTDLIIIPSLNHNFNEAIQLNQRLVEWIVEQHRKGAEIASICTGAFILAEAGLLDGKLCSTHWSVAEDFIIRFPNVHLKTDQLITEENGIYTNGGAYSFLNLMIYLIEKYYDRQTAIYCSKVFQIEIDRFSQSPFIIFKGQKFHDDILIREAQEFIESDPGKRISIQDLVSKLPIGRRQFDRRFFKATGNTPLEYIQRVKVEVAKKNLEISSKNINEIMFEVGYSDEKAFREVFRKITGLNPLEYQSRYNKNFSKIPS